MSDPTTGADERYQCEQCGQEMQDPATTESFRGYRGMVTLTFCRSCTNAGSTGGTPR